MTELQLNKNCLALWSFHGNTFKGTSTLIGQAITKVIPNDR